MIEFEVKIGNKPLETYKKLVLRGLRMGKPVAIKALGGRIDEAFKVLDEVKAKIPHIGCDIKYEPYFSEVTQERKPRVVILISRPSRHHDPGGKRIVHQRGGG